MTASEANSCGKTVLVVEDAEAIRKMVCSMLAQSGYNCLEAGDGEEALQLVAKCVEAIDLVLTDMTMPRMNGKDLAHHLARQRPEIRIVFMSGYMDDPSVREMERWSSAFLAKPFTAAALTSKVREALDRPWTGLPVDGSSFPVS